MNHVESTATDIEPDPAYLERLEWQVATEARRHQRFGTTVERVASGWKSARSLLVLCLITVAATSVGAVGAIAISGPSLVDARMAALRATTHLELARTAERLAAEGLHEVRMRFDAGVASPSERTEAELALRHALTASRLADSIVREVAARRSSAVDSLGAWTVRGTDYIGERLRIRLDDAIETQAAAEQQLERTGAMLASGIISRGELDAAEAESGDALRAVRVLADLLELRAAVLDGTILPGDAELLGRRTELEAELERLRVAHEQLDRASQRTAMMVERGLVGPGAQRDHDAQLATLDAATRLTIAELDVIQRLLAE